jgi:hypothetical protein
MKTLIQLERYEAQLEELQRQAVHTTKDKEKAIQGKIDRLITKIDNSPVLIAAWEERYSCEYEK